MVQLHNSQGNACNCPDIRRNEEFLEFPGKPSLLTGLKG